jgi:hypothetical protein
MRKEYQKMFVSCFVGGVVGTVIAVLVGVNFWWLGLVAGFATGYISYEFRQVVVAMPSVWGYSVSRMNNTRIQFIRYCCKKLRQNWPSAVKVYQYDKPQPFLVVGVSAFFFVLTSMLQAPSLFEDGIVSGVLGILVLAPFLSFLCSVVVYMFVLAGSNVVEQKDWMSLVNSQSSRSTGEWQLSPRFNGEPSKYQETALTYGRAIRWFLEGVFLVPLVILWGGLVWLWSMYWFYPMIYLGGSIRIGVWSVGSVAR